MKIKVATVQMKSLNNDYEGNLSRAEGHIKDAISQEAKLILLPEFALVGYEFTDSIWKMAEPLEGRTYSWLKGLCERHNVYIGTCILESYEGDFYDTLILVGPGEDALWVHRKIEPASYEAFFFKGAGINSNVFDTPIGRIGVVICLDATKTHTISSLVGAKLTILLMAYSWPDLPHFLPKKDREHWVEAFASIPQVYAQYLHVPVVSSNKTGRFISPVPLLKGLKIEADFTGRSSIVDQNGEVVSSISKDAGILVEEVELGKPDVSAGTNIIQKDRWLFPFSTIIKLSFDMPLIVGRLRYRWSRRRKTASQIAFEEPRC
jgi:N-carbamoylputrescine amidase